MSYQLYVDHDFYSPWAMAAFVTLTEKSLPFTLHPINLDQGAQHLPGYQALSPIQRVPLLVDGDFRLAESTAICEYLEDRHPDRQAVYPSEPARRAQARQVQAWLRSDLLALRQQRTTVVVFSRPEPTPLNPAGQQAADKLRLTAETLLAHQGENLFGNWCIADADLALMLMRLLKNGEPLSTRLTNYAQLQWARPSLQAWRRLQQQTPQQAE